MSVDERDLLVFSRFAKKIGCRWPLRIDYGKEITPLIKTLNVKSLPKEVKMLFATFLLYPLELEILEKLDENRIIELGNMIKDSNYKSFFFLLWGKYYTIRKKFDAARELFDFVNFSAREYQPVNKIILEFKQEGINLLRKAVSEDASEEDAVVITDFIVGFYKKYQKMVANINAKYTKCIFEDILALLSFFASLTCYSLGNYKLFNRIFRKLHKNVKLELVGEIFGLIENDLQEGFGFNKKGTKRMFEISVKDEASFDKFLKSKFLYLSDIDSHREIISSFELKKRAHLTNLVAFQKIESIIHALLDLDITPLFPEYIDLRFLNIIITTESVLLRVLNDCNYEALIGSLEAMLSSYFTRHTAEGMLWAATYYYLLAEDKKRTAELLNELIQLVPSMAREPGANVSDIIDAYASYMIADAKNYEQAIKALEPTMQYWGDNLNFYIFLICATLAVGHVDKAKKLTKSLKDQIIKRRKISKLVDPNFINLFNALRKGILKEMVPTKKILRMLKNHIEEDNFFLLYRKIFDYPIKVYKKDKELLGLN